MWPRALPGPRGAAAETVIGPRCLVRGRLEGTGAIRVEGRFEGEIAGECDVVVGEEGELIASVRGRDVRVAGLLRGDVHASGRLEIAASGRLSGDVEARQLVIADGASFTGHCETVEAVGPDSPPLIARASAEAPAPVLARPAPDPAAGRGEDLRLRLRAAAAIATRAQP